MAKQEKLKNVWEIEKDGNVSYLIGSMHALPYSHEEDLREYLEKAVNVAFEIDMKTQPAMKPEEVYILSGTLEDVLPKETVDKVKKISGWEKWQTYRHLTPQMVYMMLNQDIPKNKGWKNEMDLDCYKMAKGEGKNVVGLEDIQEHYDLFFKMPKEKAVASLAEIDKSAESLDQMLLMYESGDMGPALEEMRKDHDTYKAFVEDRDEILANGMDELFEDGPSLVCVGVAHSPGIISRLEKKGYKIKKVSS